MKKYINIIVLSITLAVAGTITYALIDFEGHVQFATHGGNMSTITYPPNSDTAFGGVLFDETPSDTLRYYEYKQIEDSLKAIKTTIDNNNKSTFGEGKILKHFGIKKLVDSRNHFAETKELDAFLNKIHPDTFQRVYYRINAENLSKDSLKYFETKIDKFYKQRDHLYDSLFKLKEKQRQQDAKHYLVLNEYYLDHEKYNSSISFFLRNGTYNLLYPKWDSTTIRNGDTTKHGHYESKQIAVRYSETEHQILVPISKNKYQFINTSFWIFHFLFIFSALYLFIVLPLKVIYNISKGNAFTKTNISILNLLAWVIFVYQIFDTILPILLNWYYNSIIPEEFTSQSFYTHLGNNLNKYLWAIGLFAIAKAFKRGYKLQQEQALTI
jgi:hypothetical protein